MVTRLRPASDDRISPALLFVAVLGLLVAATAGMWLRYPALGGRVRNITRAERPSSDHYLALDHGGHVDHHVLYFGTDAEALAHLRRADVLLLGNSRLMFAARPRVLDAFFEARGLRYYVLGFGFREADRFPLAIIEKFDLRPRLVIVNADGFFSDSVSDFGATVLQDSRFGAVRLQWEAEAAHEARRAMHLLVPNWLSLFGRPGFRSRREMVAYRSRTDGSWQMSPWDPGEIWVPYHDPAQPPLTDWERAAARRFKSAMDRRGAALVLTFVPNPMPLGGGPALFADLLRVPFVQAEPAGLRTQDGDHLDEASAVGWTEAFVAGLGRVIP
ncbi:MAG: hypothetical protein OEW19_06525 [Acidobacteriota bacterium]|nr:hypothetical protein [Acidobacteriota bacterium]